MIKLFLSIPLLLSVANSAETSMFGAGDLDSPSPYGLTKAEKVIVKTKNSVAKNEKQIKRVDVVIDDISQRIDALESLIEGDSQKLNKVFLNLNKQIKKSENSSRVNKLSKESYKRDNEQFRNDIDELKNSVNENIENINRLKLSFDKIVKTVNKVNKNYVTRAEFNKLLKLLDKQPRAVVSQKKSNKNSVDTSKSKKQLMADVRVLFKKDYFTKALPILDYLIQKNYKPAECNYYLGEIHYYRKKYKDALHYFKTSMMLYDKASYLPKLLLHSAISFDKTGDSENAENFYTTLIEIYPDTPEAKTASKKIK
ncbi:MAG: hypothetical protein U9R39_04270 [Campylobacterota bacterium]|nr:hypothetical protein [Campylobacterota bacterium]